jgi:predicted permease
MRWLKQLFTRRRRYDELSESIREHLDEKIADLMDRGMTQEQAERTARREFGNVTRIEERSREVWQWPTLESICADLRYALRQLRKSPAFALLTVLILTLGIGLNVAVFSLVYHILLEPLPFPQPNHLYSVWARSNAQGNPQIAASGPDFLDYQDQSRSFTRIAEYLPYYSETWTGDGEPRLLHCAGISEGFFDMLGVGPYLGRFYTAKEYTDLRNPTVVVSYRFWKSKLGADPHVLGRMIHTNEVPLTIIGVAPPLPDLFPDTDIFAEVNTRPSWEFMKWQANKFLRVMGRLKTGITPAMAEHELTGILRRASGEPPDVQVQLIPLKEDLVGSVRTQLKIIVLAVGLVLLLTCINVAALLLARSARRSAELAVRLSLGAGRARLRQQLLTEGFVLTLVACSPAILVAWLALRLLPHLPALGLPRLEGVHLNGPALLATTGIAFLTTLVFGWAPSLMFFGFDLASSLRTGRASTGLWHRRFFSSLIVAEIACSMVLSICAGLLLHSYWRLSQVNSGFEPDHMLTTYLRTLEYGPAGRSFWRDVLEGTGSLPGVHAVALGDCTPGQGASPATLVLGDRPNNPNHAPPTQGCWISSDFFRVSGTPLIRGRFLDSGDNADSTAVVIINEQAARRYWPGEDPIGKLIGVNYTGPGRVGSSTPRMRQIVGVVQGTKFGSPDSPTEPAVYMPYLQDETYHDLATMSLFVRSAGNPLALDDAIRAKIHAIRPAQPVDEIRSMQHVVSGSLAPRRYSLSLLAAFAALALLISAVGMYAIVSYTTQQKTREFGIRIAVGATRGNVMAVVFRQGLILTLTGISIGLAAAFATTRTVAQILFGVSPFDAVSFCSSLVFLVLISFAACIVPALRSAYLNPVNALRSE